jgi:hypothetical protein
MKIIPQRRWVRFSLASLFGLIAIIATVCAFTLKRLELYTDQVTLVARIAEVDPNKLWQYFDGEQPASISLGSGRLAGIKVTPPEGWMSDVANFLGRPYRADVTHILLVGQSLDYYDILDQLRQLPRLKCLTVRDAQVTSDVLESLSSFGHLEELWLRKTTASVEQVRVLQKRLPNTTVKYD